MHDYTIETERLILRPLKIDDAEAVYQWVSDERVAKYMVYNTYTSLEAVVEWLTMLQKTDEEYHFGFVRKEDGLLIGSGSIGPDSARSDFWSFGYNLRYDCWGNGFATEATKAMMKFAKKLLTKKSLDVIIKLLQTKKETIQNLTNLQKLNL